ncbi:hypothetical protein [Leptospira ellinghausenii]|uniref:hypothetical protein n=1 Tax=Leptospira ellinghausenii TaxID=1917822 RepID=UPI00107FB9F0|nr:hypothetical protein [Leptospira ellinghausenii]
MKSFQWVFFCILLSSFLTSCFETKEKEEIDTESLVLLTALATPRTSGPTSIQFTKNFGNTAYLGFKGATIYLGVPNSSAANITITPTGFTHNFVGTGRMSVESSISPLSLTGVSYAKDFEKGTISGTAPAGASTVNSRVIYTTSLSGGIVSNPQVFYPLVIKYDTDGNLARLKCKSAIGAGCTSLFPYTCDASASCTSNSECSSLTECVYNQ